MLQYAIRDIGSTLDPYGKITSVNLSKFVVSYYGLCEFGGKSGEN
jgi:hypothetical protein